MMFFGLCVYSMGFCAWKEKETGRESTGYEVPVYFFREDGFAKESKSSLIQHCSHYKHQKKGFQYGIWTCRHLWSTNKESVKAK